MNAGVYIQHCNFDFIQDRAVRRTGTCHIPGQMNRQGVSLLTTLKETVPNIVLLLHYLPGKVRMADNLKWLDWLANPVSVLFQILFYVPIYSQMQKPRNLSKIGSCASVCINNRFWYHERTSSPCNNESMTYVTVVELH